MKYFDVFMIIFVLLPIESNTKGIFLNGRDDIFPADESKDEKVQTRSEQLEENQDSDQQGQVFSSKQGLKTEKIFSKLFSRKNKFFPELYAPEDREGETLTKQQKLQSVRNEQEILNDENAKEDRSIKDIQKVDDLVEKERRKFIYNRQKEHTTDNFVRKNRKKWRKQKRVIDNLPTENSHSNAIDNNNDSKYVRFVQYFRLKDPGRNYINVLFYVLATQAVMLTTCGVIYIIKKLVTFCKLRLEKWTGDVALSHIDQETLKKLRFINTADTDRSFPMVEEKLPNRENNDFYLYVDKFDKDSQTEDIYFTNLTQMESDKLMEMEETPISHSVTDLKFLTNEEEEEVDSEMQPLLTISEERKKSNLKQPKRFFSFGKRNRNKNEKVRFNFLSKYRDYDKNLDESNDKLDFTRIRAIPADKISWLKELYEVLIKMDREGFFRKNSSSNSNFDNRIDKSPDTSQRETLETVPSEKCLLERDDRITHPFTESSSEDWDESPV